jgi:site-specific DNA-methyltransferase (adenine-specific)
MTPALDHDRCAIIHGDALTTMHAMLADKSVDIVITDPPYGNHTHAKLGAERRNDGVAPRAQLEFPPLSHDDVIALATEFVRVSRGWIIVFTDDRSCSWWGEALEAACGKWVRTGHWIKTNPMPQMTGDRPSVGTEPIIIGHATGKAMAWNGRGHAAAWRGPRDHDAEHPNQKPEWLMQALLGSFAPAGGLALDPFFGSGTTGTAALKTNRLAGEVVAETHCSKCARKLAEEWQPPMPDRVKVIGIEGDRKWVDHSVARILPNLLALAA